MPKKKHSVQNSVQYIKSNVMSKVYKFTYGNSSSIASSIHPKKSRQATKKSFASPHMAKKNLGMHTGSQADPSGWPLKLKFEKKSLVSGVLMGKCRRSPMTGEITMPAPENFSEVLQTFVLQQTPCVL